MSKTAFVGNLSYTATEEELRQLFAEAGPVVKARIGMDRETGKSRGFAFVEFETDEACAAAIERLNGVDLGGRRLRVNDADDKPPARGPGGPGPGFSPGGPRPPFPGRPPGNGRFVPRPPVFTPEPPPQDFFGRSSFDGGDDGPRRPPGKGSRRGIRARKRSLWG